MCCDSAVSIVLCMLQEGLNRTTKWHKDVNYSQALPALPHGVPCMSHSSMHPPCGLAYLAHLR